MHVSEFPPVTGCWFLTAPTASGKTELGIRLALQLKAEIISLDSMALYRGMDVGTAKPNADQLRLAPHHLIDSVDPEQEYSLAQYVRAAHAATHDIKSRGLNVLFVGGTPLYLKALLRGIFEGPPADWAYRERLQAEIAASGPEQLHARLAEVDLVTAAKLHPRDTRRIVRALEVYDKLGRRISELQSQFDAAPSADKTNIVYLLQWPREELHARIDRRVDAMFSAGLVNEVRQLTAAGRKLSRTAAQAVGYREVLEHLAGHHDLPTAIQLVKTRTRQFAKRQGTWFRSLSECRPILMTENVDVDALAGRLATTP